MMVMGDDLAMQRTVAEALRRTGSFSQVQVGSRPCHVNAQWNGHSFVRTDRGAQERSSSAST